jgi:MFS family permease
MPKIESNILKYYLFSAFSFTPVSLPVFVLFWQQNGLDFFQIYILQGIFSLAIVLWEVPTGMIADQAGRRKSLIVATSALTFAFLLYGTGHSFFSFMVAELIIALGVSLLSGADTALLYDTLKKINRENEYQQIEGRARAIQMITFAGCNLIGGFIGNYSYRATVFLSAIGPFIALLVSLKFTEINTFEKNESIGEAFLSYKKLMASSIKFIKKHRLIRWHIFFSAVLTGSAGWLLWLYQPYMQWTGLPVWGLGIAFATFNIFAALMSNFAHRLEGIFTPVKMIFILIILQVLPLFFLALVIHPLSFLFILGQQAVRGISRPLIYDWVLKYTFSDKRATVLSICSMAGRLFFAGTSPFFGYIANTTSFPLNFLLQAAVLIVILTVLVIMYLKIPAKYFQIKDSVYPKQ